MIDKGDVEGFLGSGCFWQRSPPSPLVIDGMTLKMKRETGSVRALPTEYGNPLWWP